MINRVDAQHSYIAPYDRAGRRAVHKDGDAPAFLLEQGEKGVVYEHGASREAAEEAAAKRRAGTDREKPGSGKAQTKREVARDRELSAVKTAPAEESEKGEQTEAGAKGPSFDIGGFLRQTAGRVRAFFAGIVRSIWYGNEDADGAGGNGKAVDTPAVMTGGRAGDGGMPQEDPGSAATVRERAADERSLQKDPDRYSDARIRELLAKRDEAGFMDALTRGHTRIPARNTSLLTYYDRRGRLVGPPLTDSTRILKGDGAGRDTVRRPQGNYRRFI